MLPFVFLGGLLIVRKIKREGVFWFLFGALVMGLSPFLLTLQGFFYKILMIMAEPAGWFFLATLFLCRAGINILSKEWCLRFLLGLFFFPTRLSKDCLQTSFHNFRVT